MAEELYFITENLKGKKVAINPYLVRLVAEIANGNIAIHFDENHVILIKDSLERVVKQLEGALRARLA
jgi:hypothetical protein